MPAIRSRDQFTRSPDTMEHQAIRQVAGAGAAEAAPGKLRPTARRAAKVLRFEVPPVQHGFAFELCDTVTLPVRAAARGRVRGASVRRAPAGFSVEMQLTTSVLDALRSLQRRASTAPWAGSFPAALAREGASFTLAERIQLEATRLMRNEHGKRHRSPHWGSARQWERSGATIMDAERGVWLVDRSGLDLSGASDTHGPLVEMFSAEQVHGRKTPAELAVTKVATREAPEAVRAFARRLGADVVESLATSASWCGSRLAFPRVSVVVPVAGEPRETALASRMLQALVRWAAERRLCSGPALELVTRERTELAARELTVELAAAALALELGVSYIGGGLAIGRIVLALEQDPALMHRAAGDAERRANELVARASA